MARHMDPLVKQDLAKLDKDPDTRRIAMDSLKGYVEQLDVKSMPHFLDQVSEARESEASRPYAISLFVEVARVHKHAVVPFIPRIMSSVVRTLPSSGASQHLQEACTKVVASVARFTVEPTRPPSYNEEILRGLCDPLLGVLSSKLEPLAVGAAKCLQEIVESEKWKFASQDLENDLCLKGTIALAEKGTQTVAHMQLMCSLAKFNPSIMQKYGAEVLKAAVEILRGAGGTGRSWQHSAAAAQLLSVVLRAVDEETLEMELGPTMEALDHCRLDKVQVVRKAVAEALSTAKCLASEKHLKNRSSCEDNPLPSSLSPRQSNSRKHGRRRRLWKADGSPQAKQVLPGSQESQIVSYSSSPAPSTQSSDSVLVNSPSTVASSTCLQRSPLYPAKQSPAKPTSSTVLSSASSDFDDYILAQCRSVDSKENAPISRKSGAAVERLSKMKLSDDLEGSPKGDVKDSFYPHRGQNDLKEDQEDDCLSFAEEFGYDDGGLYTEEAQESPCLDDGLASFRIGDLELEGAGCFGRGLNLHAEEFGSNDHGKESQVSVDMSLGWPNYDALKRNIEDGLQNGTIQDCESINGGGDGIEIWQSNRPVDVHQDNTGVSNGCMDPLMASNGCYNSLAARLVNLQDAISPQRPKVQMTAEDFLLFTTPRRLVRALQSSSLTPESRGTPACDLGEGIDMDTDTLSEAGWSVRDNPIADDSEEDPPDQSGLEDTVSRKETIPANSGCCEDDGQCSDIGAPGIALEKDMTVVNSSKGLSQPNLYVEGSGKSKKFNKEELEDPHVGAISERTRENGTTKDDFVYPLVRSKMSYLSSTRVGQEKWRNTEKGILGWLKVLADRDWSWVIRTLDQAQSCAEVFLSGLLCVVLILPIAIVVTKWLNAHGDIHVLLPT